MNLPSNKLQRLIEDVAISLDIPPPSFLPKERELSWNISKTHHLKFHVHNDAFVVTSIIGSTPARDKEEFYLLLMRANFLGQGTKDAILGMDQEEKSLTLSLIIPYEIDSKTFKEKLEDFVNFVDYWRDELDRHTKTKSILS